MHDPRYAASEVCRLGKEIYDQTLRAVVETDANVGRLISIDIETGDYEIGDDILGPTKLLRARHPNASVYGARIGYDAVYAVGGSIRRTAQ